MGVLLYSKMKLLLLSVLAAVALAGQADYAKLQFAQFKEQYGKAYKTRTEHQMRFDIFQANLKKIEEHNKSGASWKKGINQFSVELILVLWMELLVLEDLAIMNSTYVANVVFSLMSHILLELMNL